MLDLYYWPTPNGCKVTILLHELGVAYKLIPLDIGAGDQFRPEFSKISPNRRMPAIVDHEPAGGGEPLSIFESGAILMYLADKHGRFWPSSIRERYDVAQWVMWQMAGLGPMCGQAHHFNQYVSKPVPYAAERYTKEVNRLYGVLDARLSEGEFIAGEYSIADMACWPWIKPYRGQGQDLDEFVHLKRWFLALNKRPGVREGWNVGRDWLNGGPVVTEASKSVLFGQTAARN
jgi:GSH-dependent disulfide-bond oxidoreductase